MINALTAALEKAKSGTQQAWVANKEKRIEDTVNMHGHVDFRFETNGQWMVVCPECYKPKDENQGGGTLCTKWALAVNR